MNNDCCGSGPHTAGEVRVLPAGGDSNLILCFRCFHRELAYRRQRNTELGEFAQFALPKWTDLKLYETV